MISYAHIDDTIIMSGSSIWLTIIDSHGVDTLFKNNLNSTIIIIEPNVQALWYRFVVD